MAAPGSQRQREEVCVDERDAACRARDRRLIERHSALADEHARRNIERRAAARVQRRVRRQAGAEGGNTRSCGAGR